MNNKKQNYILTTDFEHIHPVEQYLFGPARYDSLSGTVIEFSNSHSTAWTLQMLLENDGVAEYITHSITSGRLTQSLCQMSVYDQKHSSVQCHYGSLQLL